jgi:hypothetical protein
MSKKKALPRGRREKVGRVLVHAPNLKVSMTFLGICAIKKAEPYKEPYKLPP